MLQLAADGLADDEIARRLGISGRKVREEFESVFAKFGVRSRERAITVWSRALTQPALPHDRCPYHRPFPSQFSDCVAYRPRRVATLDSRNEPTAAIWTCINLGANPRDDIGWYAGCAIGKPADRERWAAEHSQRDQLGTIDAVTKELAMVAGPFAQRLWSLKRQQGLAMAARENAASATGAMEALAAAFMLDLAAVLHRHGPRLDGADLSAERCLDLAQRLIAGIVPDSAPADWDERFDRLLRLPEEAWSAGLPRPQSG